MEVEALKRSVDDLIQLLHVMEVVTDASSSVIKEMHMCLKKADFNNVNFEMIPTNINKIILASVSFWPDRKRGFLVYRGFYFSNFYKSVCPAVNIENLDLKNLRLSNIRVNIENKDVRKSRIFKHLFSKYGKLGFKKSEIKHGFIKIGEKNPRYLRNPRFQPGRILLTTFNYRACDKCRPSTFNYSSNGTANV